MLDDLTMWPWRPVKIAMLVIPPHWPIYSSCILFANYSSSSFRRNLFRSTQQPKEKRGGNVDFLHVLLCLGWSFSLSLWPVTCNVSCLFVDCWWRVKRPDVDDIFWNFRHIILICILQIRGWSTIGSIQSGVLIFRPIVCAETWHHLRNPIHV